ADRMKLLAEDLQDQIEAIPGVKQAAIAGTREREIRIEIDLYRLTEYKIPLSTVTRRIAEENRTISAGNLEMGDNKFQVRIPGEYTLINDMRDLVLLVRDGAPVYLKDVATVSDTFKDLSSISRLNGQPCVSIRITKRSDENTISLISRINSVLDKFPIPEGIKLTIIRDQSEMVRMMLGDLENSVVTAIILVLIVLMIVMGLRNSLFVAMAIPYSMLIAFIAIDAMGLTLNMIVLFSLVLTVGMVVDNGIVIVENIYRNRTLGLSRIEAARRGASEVAWPVITSTLTTLLAFTPLLFWPGMIVG
ncbi:efflux RND transporter permease subunit, partial [Verrucomicrobiota bacterium]